MRNQKVDTHAETTLSGGNGATPPPQPDDFNPEDYRYTLASSGPGVRRQLSIPNGRPKQFFRIDTRPEYCQEAAIHTDKEGFNSEDYLVAPPQQQLLGERRVKRAVIRVCILRPHILRLWAVTYPNGDGRSNNWIETAWQVAEAAETQWVRFELNESGTGWDVFYSSTQWPEPEWPAEPMSELIQKSFKGKFINSDDHVILRRLRGEI